VRRDRCHVEGVSQEFTELLESMEFGSMQHTEEGAHSAFIAAILIVVLGRGMLLLLSYCLQPG
jgi:hypothetical protein